jgi:hypothetical protein
MFSILLDQGQDTPCNNLMRFAKVVVDFWPGDEWLPFHMLNKTNTLKSKGNRLLEPLKLLGERKVPGCGARSGHLCLLSTFCCGGDDVDVVFNAWGRHEGQFAPRVLN